MLITKTVNQPYVPGNQFDPITSVFAAPRRGVMRFRPYYDYGTPPYTPPSWQNQLEDMSPTGPYFIHIHGMLGVGDGIKVAFYFDEAIPNRPRLMQEGHEPITETLMVWTQDPSNGWQWEILPASAWTYENTGDPARKKITFNSAPEDGRYVMISYFTKDYVLP